MINNKVDVKNLYSKNIQKLSVIADPILFGPLLVLFFYNLNQFALIPYLGLISENNASLITASIVGLALTSKSVAEKLSLFGISVLNLNYKKTTILTFGLFIRAICFLIINLYFNPIILIASVAIIGVAGSMIRPTVRSILNNNPNTNIKDKVFSLMFLFSNLGGIIGPLLVSLNLNIWLKNNLLACLAILDLLLALLVINIFSKEEKITDDKMVGDILVTTLQTHGTPLIRYRIGDLGKYLGRNCTCGSNTMVIDLIGRSATSFKICGTIISFEYIQKILSPFGKITESDFQLKLENISGKSKFTIFLNRFATSGTEKLIKELIEHDSLFVEILAEQQSAGFAIQLIEPNLFKTSNKTGKKLLFYNEGEH